MKKIYTLIGIISIGSVVFAQNNNPQPQVGASKNLSLNPSAIAAGKVNASTDTVDLPTYLGGGQSQIYGNFGGGYCFGVNKINFAAQGQPALYKSEKAVAQGYLTGAGGYKGKGSYKILDALVWVGAKEQVSVGSGQPLTVKIQKLDGTSTYGQNTIICPGAVLGTQTIVWGSLDTNNGMLSVASFNPPVFVSTKYAISVDFTAIAAAADTMGIVCSGQGGGIDPTLTFIGLPDQNAAMWWWEADHLYSDPNANFASRSLAIWATFDDADFIIEGEEYGFGFKLNAFPNPTNGVIKIGYAAEKNTEAKLEIFNTVGSKVFANTSSVNAGAVNNVQVDTKDFATGVYYYTVSSELGRLTKKFTVTK